MKYSKDEHVEQFKPTAYNKVVGIVFMLFGIFILNCIFSDFTKAIAITIAFLFLEFGFMLFFGKDFKTLFWNLCIALGISYLIVSLSNKHTEKTPDEQSPDSLKKD